MKIVIPMLGRASKFIQSGIIDPKPLIKIRNRYMFEWALSAIDFLNLERDTIFIIHKDHVDKWGLDEQIKKICGKKTAIKIVNFTPQGALHTVLLVRQYIDTDDELIIYNSDQFFKSDLKKRLTQNKKKIDGFIPIFHATHSRWSYVETDENDFVVKTAEKEVISNKATVGLYYFRQGKDFVKAADSTIERQIMVGGEYYVCPVYNEFIAMRKKVKAFLVEEMWSLGTPEDVYKFEKYYKGDL